MHQSGIRDAPLSQVAQRTKARFQEFSRKFLEPSGKKVFRAKFFSLLPGNFWQKFSGLGG